MKIILVAFSFLTMFSAYSQTVPVAFPSPRAQVLPSFCWSDGEKYLKETLKTFSQRSDMVCASNRVKSNDSKLTAEILCRNASNELIISEFELSCSLYGIKVEKPFVFKSLEDWGNEILSQK